MSLKHLACLIVATILVAQSNGFAKVKEWTTQCDALLSLNQNDLDSRKREHLVSVAREFTTALARRYHLEFPHVPKEDLIQEANLALFEAIRSYRPTQKTAFKKHTGEEVERRLIEYGMKNSFRRPIFEVDGDPVYYRRQLRAPVPTVPTDLLYKVHLESNREVDELTDSKPLADEQTLVSEYKELYLDSARSFFTTLKSAREQALFNNIILGFSQNVESDAALAKKFGGTTSDVRQLKVKLLDKFIRHFHKEIFDHNEFQRERANPAAFRYFSDLYN